MLPRQHFVRIIGSLVAAGTVAAGVYHYVAPSGGGGGGASWAGTFDCYGSTPNCTGLTPKTCTQTVAASSVQTALNSATGGEVICLNSGAMPSVSLSGKTYSSVVTVQPAPGAAVTGGGWNLDAVSNLQVTGVGATTGPGATMSMGGFDIDLSSGCSSNLTFDHITFTGGSMLKPQFACSHDLNITWDHDRFDNLGQETYEGRLNIQGMDTGPATGVAGVTISNSHFGGVGASSTNCSDGIDGLGSSRGVVVGPGNEFTGIAESACSNGTHVDPVQFAGATNWVVTGNWFHANGDGSGGILSADGDDGYTVENNVFDQQAGGYGLIVDVEGCTGCTVIHNWIHNSNVAVGTSNGGEHTVNELIEDNVFDNAGVNVETPGSDTYTATDNLNCGCTGGTNITGTASYVGTPANYYQWQLAAGSPGYLAAGDGKSMGITP